ncbi:hypothetical protein DIS24_g12301 [Lasiodiplodia hormozganensis]|uniref:DUF3669 domain-containing protein n=1 Tax=Lasiodiplodia hormozganensis TaxID=869390 RepID=A0AA39T0M3_9PEZI|nr:hypothetical protein DIS24_g12301 [Lasiodiplodia hormozganensis]
MNLRLKDIADNFLLLDVLENEDADAEFEENLSLEQQLGRLLSTRSKSSTTCSFTAQQQAAFDESSYRLIGWGACGAIYAKDGSSHVLKLAKTDDLQLWNDYLMHTRLWEALAQVPDISGDVRVPEPTFYVPKDEQGWWAKRLPMFPTQDIAVHLPTAVLCTERIHALPILVRHKLIEKFCAPRNRRKALQSPGNKDCLVRVYLGSRGGKSNSLFFSLRNFKLHLNQMLELEMNTFELAGCMAGALAAMHWKAKIDARDVEFVLGTAPIAYPAKPLTSVELANMELNTYTEMRVFTGLSYVQRTTHLWVLDFNQCQPISMDEAGVSQAVEAYMINDPYYPRPPVEDDDGHDSRLWSTFAIRYVRISDQILRKNPELRSFPRLFINKVMEEQAEKVKRQEKLAATTSEAP